jgi:hypothetical protein
MTDALEEFHAVIVDNNSEVNDTNASHYIVFSLSLFTEQAPVLDSYGS